MSTTAASSDLRPGSLLATSLRLDALMSGSAGVALAAAAPALDGLLGPSVAFLVPLGLFLVAYAGFLVLVVRAGAPAPAVKLVIAGNVGWAALSMLVVVADWLALTTTGTVVTLLQAAAVAGFAEAQLMGLRRPLAHVARASSSMSAL